MNSDNNIPENLPPVPGSVSLPPVPAALIKKNNKIAIIVACVAGGLLLLGAGVFFLIFLVFSSDEKSDYMYDEDDFANYVETDWPAQDSVRDILAKRGIYPSQYEQAIITATARGASDLLQLLLRAGVDPNTCTSRNYSILSHAIRGGHLNCVKILLDHPRIDVTHTDNFGSTVLHTAAQSKNPEIIKLLLERDDIQLNAQNNNGVTPLDAAIYAGDSRCINLLQNAGCITNKKHRSIQDIYSLYGRGY